MPDSKVTDYDPITTWTGPETLYAALAGADWRLTLTNLFASIPVLAKFVGLFGFAGTHDVISGNGTADVSKTITRVSNSSPSTLTLPAGSFDGQIKLILADTIVAQNPSVTFAGSLRSASIVFTKPGDSAIMMYTQTKWWFLGGSAVLT